MFSKSFEVVVGCLALRHIYSRRFAAIRRVEDGTEWKGKRGAVLLDYSI